MQLKLPDRKHNDEDRLAGVRRPGATVATSHVLIGDHTGAASAYVGMTRGRDRNIAHLVAESLDDARAQWITVFNRDRADLGPAHARLLAGEAIERYGAKAPRRTRPVRRVGYEPPPYRPPAASGPSLGL